MFFAVVAERLGNVLPGARCGGASLLPGGGLLLTLPGRPFSLLIRAGTEHQSIELGRPSPGGSPGDEPWDSLVSGSEITSVRQHGCDRILLFELVKERAYRSTRMTLRFEAAGRNANIVLTRDSDDRILACTRAVTGRMSSYRTIAPGSPYKAPPPSGRPPSEWGSREVQGILSRAGSSREIYSVLEGVGPSTASAILAEAGISGNDPGRVALVLAEALETHRFEPWSGQWGPLPVRMGPGEPLDDPLSAFGPALSAGTGSRLRTFLARNGSALEEARTRLAEVQTLLESLPGSDTLRLWGGMLLAAAPGIPRGAGSATLDDWEGNSHTIPLRASRSAVENAERLFRKAGNIDTEAAALRKRAEALAARCETLAREAEEAVSTGIIPEDQAVPRHERGEARQEPVEISDGWLCWIGKNSRNNEEVTFRIGRRGDWWLHARGIPGPHVVLRGRPGSGNPPAAVLRHAAELAAEGAACTSEVVPVDWTQVQHVRRMKGGRPGEVTYTRERTIFVCPGGDGRGKKIRGRGRAYDAR